MSSRVLTNGKANRVLKNEEPHYIPLETEILTEFLVTRNPVSILVVADPQAHSDLFKRSSVFKTYRNKLPNEFSSLRTRNCRIRYEGDIPR